MPLGSGTPSEKTRQHLYDNGRNSASFLVIGLALVIKHLHYQLVVNFTYNYRNVS